MNAVSGDPIWLYWAGEMPEYIHFCVETIRAWHPGRVVFATEDDLKAALDDIGAPLGHRYIVQHEADILRAWLLKERGGYWIDCDFLCFAPVDGIVPPGHNFAAYRRFQDDESVDNDFIWAAPLSPVAAAFYERLKATMTFHNFEIPQWAAIGGNILTALMNEKPDGAHEIDYELVTFARRMCLQLDTFMPNEVEDPMLPEGVRGVMLVHSLSHKYLGGRSFDDLIKSRTVIGALFRAAIRRLTTHG